MRQELDRFCEIFTKHVKKLSGVATPSVFPLDLVFCISSCVLVFFHGYLVLFYEWAECN